MLRIVVNTSSAGAKSYYTSADYYSEGQELVGTWHGKAADKLGLLGEVTKSQWDALCDNLRPTPSLGATIPDQPRPGTKLMPRTKSERRVGYDFNFHAPKSLSLLYNLTGDSRILSAFEQSVQETMQELERDAATRVRSQGANQDRTTGNLVWGSFTHLTARPVEGVPDPHLHSHCFVFNTTYDANEQRWKAAQFGSINRDAPYFEAVFHSLLARRIEGLGLATIRTKTGWELAGLDKSTLTKYSRRTTAIEALAKSLGIDDPGTKANLGAQTRSSKSKELGMGELRDLWRSRLTGEEAATVEAIAGRIGTAPIGEDDKAGPAAITRSIDHVFERASVVPERVLLAHALKQGVGKASRAAIEDGVRREHLIRGERKGRMMVTTREVLKEEQRILSYARNGRGACKPIVGGIKDGVTTGRITVRRTWLNPQQQAAVRHVLTSKDRVMLIRGAAGAGKTSALLELKDQLAERGHDLHAFAPTGEASRGVLRESGFPDADTLAHLLVDPTQQAAIHDSVVVVDEAGLIGTRSMSKLFDVVDQAHARLVLVGDIEQHGPVERGEALRLLETDAGLTPIHIKEIQRQRARYKQAIEHLCEGRTAEGFDGLDQLGWIREVPDEDRSAALASAYVESVMGGKSTLVVSPTHAEGEQITAAIREKMRARAMLGEDDHQFIRLVATNATLGQRKDVLTYQPGDVLVFQQNAKGFRKAQRLIVTDPTQPQAASTASQLAQAYGAAPVTIEHLPLDQAHRFAVFKPSTLSLTSGDRIRIAAGGKLPDGHRLNSGDVFDVKGFTPEGDILLANGWQVPKQFGHLSQGFVVTSHASQGKTVDRVIIGQSSSSFMASSKEQFYVSASRGREQALVFTDNKHALLDAVQQHDERLTATALIQGSAEPSRPGPARTRDATPQSIAKAPSMNTTPASEPTKRWRIHQHAAMQRQLAERPSAALIQPSPQRDGRAASGYVPPGKEPEHER